MPFASHSVQLPGCQVEAEQVQVVPDTAFVIDVQDGVGTLLVLQLTS